MAVFLAMLTALTVFIISASYSQTIDEFPDRRRRLSGRDQAARALSRAWSRERSGHRLRSDHLDLYRQRRRRDFQLPAGLVAATSNSGSASLVVILLVGMNLRGVKESVLSLLPIFIAFVILHVFLITYALVDRAPEIPHAVQLRDSCRRIATASQHGLFRPADLVVPARL